MPGIVLHLLKAVYWPIPKTGSTVLKRHIANVLNLGNFPEMTVHNAPFEMTEDSIPEYEDFAFVRNPYVRLYSLWCDKILNVSELDPNVFSGLEDIVVPGMPFIDFVYAILFQTRRYDPHWMPQVTQMPLLCTAFKIEESPLRFLFAKENQHIKGRWRSAYNDALMVFVYQFYKKDFVRFDYAK